VFSYQQAHRAADAARLQQRWTRAELEERVLETYYALRLADARIDAFAAREQASATAARQAARTEQQGLAPPLEVLQAGARLAELRASVAQARADRAALQARLHALLGSRRPVEIVATDDIPRPPDRLEPSLDDALAGARGARADVNAQERAIRAAEAGLQAARAEKVPSLGAIASFLWQGDAPFSGQNSGWLIGGILRWKAFDGLGQEGQMQEHQTFLYSPGSFFHH
jgi:outer membrane protein